MATHTRTVMITGSAGNPGRCVAASFHAGGANVVLVDLRRESLEKAFGAEDERRLFAPTDLLEQEQVDGAVKAAIERFGRIDVLCNLAGGFRMGEAVHAIERGGGKIVNVGAFSAQRGLAGMGPYCAAKGAVIRLTEAMAAELREKNINVNCVLPTIIDTPENRTAMPDADPARWAAPQDLANAILFLASDDARAIHGAALPVTGLS